MLLTLKLEPDGDKWHAFCPELKGCHTFGSTKAEALKHLKEAVMLYLDDELENQSMNTMIQVVELGKMNKKVHNG